MKTKQTSTGFSFYVNRVEMHTGGKENSGYYFTQEIIAGIISQCLIVVNCFHTTIT